LSEKPAHGLVNRLLLFSLGAAACVLVYLFLLSFQPTSRSSPTAGVIPVLVLAICTGWLTAYFLRADGLPPATLGLAASHRPFVRFWMGLVAGSVLTGLWLAIVTVATGATMQLNPNFAIMSFSSACVFAFFNNLGEELIYRGYVFVRLAEYCGEVITVVITSAVFALLHLQAGLPWRSVLAGVFTSGLVFGATFARWRSLPLALGLHVATNIVQEATGLRPSAASIAVPVFPTTSAAAGPILLAGIAALNLALAAGILFLGRRQLKSIWRPDKSLERTRKE
jgi:membrane protease YdiL (CAAX protease family)